MIDLLRLLISMAVFENSTPTKRMQIKMTWMAMN